MHICTSKVSTVRAYLRASTVAEEEHDGLACVRRLLDLLTELMREARERHGPLAGVVEDVVDDVPQLRQRLSRTRWSRIYHLRERARAPERDREREREREGERESESERERKIE